MQKVAKKNRILICGGTGFIGQNLVKELLRQGRKINLFVYGRIPQSLRNKKLKIFKGNIFYKRALKRALKESDIVVNLIGSYYVNIYLLNVLSSASLLEVCKESNIKKIIFVSTEAVYGEYPGRSYTESHRPEPLTEYALAKYLAEQLYKFYSDKYNIPTIILRLSNTYGSGQKTGAVFDFLTSILKNYSVTVHNDGKQRRGFLYVDDAVNGIIKSIDYKLKGFEIFNISGRKAYSLLELISLIEKNLGKRLRVKFVKYNKLDIRYMYSSHQKAKHLLSYEPKVRFKEGIARTIDYFKNIKKK